MMGCYSWKYCDDARKRMIAGKVAKSYLLIPAAFGGGYIVETRYDGYGNMGGYDVYECVADWNKEHISADCIEKPSRENWDDTEEGQVWYEGAVKRYEMECEMLSDFKLGKTNAEMEEKYGKDWKREIGILIACDDENNKRLKYPIKIASKETSVYEDCKPSLKDPMQGCY